MEYTDAKIKDIFVEFLKSFKDSRNELKYRTQISQLPPRGGKSVVVDYPDLLAYNNDIATNLVREPELYLKSFDEAAHETLGIENPVYADKIRKELHVRVRELTDRVSLRGVTKDELNMLIQVAGMVTRTSELRPLAMTAAFRCTNQHITYVEQSGTILKKPVKCETEGCGETKSFELDDMKTDFIDFQVIRIQEMPEELPPGQLPQSFDVHLMGDVVNSARPGDRIVLTGIVKAESDYAGAATRLRLFNNRIEANFVEQLGKRPEDLEITREEEERIRAFAQMPGAYDRLVSSVAPAIFGHELHKEAALLLMIGSPQKVLPDGSTLRGDLNVLLVGDPGCLVFDERIVLGDGTISKIGQMGNHHLQSISTKVLTGEGGGKRALATRFHIYRNQPVMEIITESGKSVKGTHNHPLLARTRKPGSRENEWRKLDQFQVGDRVVVSSGYPCYVTWNIQTKFKPVERRSNYGPAFKGRLPQFMDEDLASFCGYMLGDGWVRTTGEQTGFVVADTDKDILPRLCSLAESLFGLKVHVHSKKAPGRTVLLHYATIHSKDVAANLRFLQTKRVPDLILSSGNKVVAAFLRWLYEADGTVSASKTGRGVGCVGLKSVEIELLRDVQLLLLRFGIHSRIIGNALVIRRGGDVKKFAKSVGFASSRKKVNLRRLLALSIGKRQVHGQRLERVVKIVEHPPQDVFDIEVPEGHRFIANGVISHNTAKSELLKYVARIAPRGLYTSGRGSTAAGLTAAVVKEKNGMMMLEAGATVLADLGIACIDEFDKMRDEDRSALHEVMEQQSYHPFVEIALADGRRVHIGDYVESLLHHYKDRVIAAGKDCEVLPLAGEGPEIYSCDISTGTVSRIRVDRVSRHKSPGNFVTIKYSNGRKITVTPDHPVFVYRGKSITTVPAAEVTIRDYVPTPRFVPNSSVPVALTVACEPVHRSKTVRIPSVLTPELGRLLGYLISEGHSYAGSSFEIGFSNSDETILDDVQRLFDTVFGIRPSIRLKEGVTTQRYISKTLYEWFTRNFQEIMHLAREKRVPTKIHGSSVNVIREFLSAAFLGDGSVESTSFCYRTASPGLAEDYQDLLHKLGILSRIVYDRSNDSFKVCIMGDSFSIFFDKVVEKFDKRFERLKEFQRKSARTLRSHDTLPPQVAVEIKQIMESLGISHANYFYEHTKHHFGVNLSVAEKYLHAIDATIFRLDEFSRGPWTSLKSARLALGFSQQRLANLSGMKRSAIAYLENGGYGKASVEMIQRLRQGVGECAETLRLKSERIRKLCGFRFLRITDVEVVPNDGPLKTEWVYDVTVEPSNNFVSKGVILHNTASVAKGGIIATLNARTSILAAANPVDGKYDPYKNILDNVALPVPLLTRFDLVFIIRDEPDQAKDETVAKHILDLRAKATYPVAPSIDFDLLKKYVIYAKKLDPELTEEARNRLSNFYIKMRREASPEQLSVTPRWLEGLVRLSIARARVLLHPRVTEDDALHAINLVERMLQTVAVDQTTKKVDIGVLYNKPLSEKGLRESALEVFKKLSGESKQPVEDKVFYEEMEKAGKFGREQIEKVFQDMWKSGVIYESKPHFFKKA
ncbi:MAG TPA: LAGLIDADG family homing endonuclease [Nitrososphaerales archaeon]|nr:LAGLIDADG family homing endonuclease [Nitrososphaerales archaeon]